MANKTKLRLNQISGSLGARAGGNGTQNAFTFAAGADNAIYINMDTRNTNLLSLGSANVGIALDGAISGTKIALGAGNLLTQAAGIADDDFLRIDGTTIEGRSAAEVLSDIEGCEFVCADANDYVAKVSGARTFDRIVLFDILEHMELDDAIQLLKGLRSILSKGGKVLLRMPNVSSPWGQRMFYGSFDHVTPYTPDRVKELAFMTGYTCLNVVGQTTGKWRKRVLENALHGILNRVLTYHPQIWQANLLCVFELKNKED